MPKQKPDVSTRALQKAFADGEQQGLTKGRQEIFDWLEAKYIHHPNRPDRGTPEANALLMLVSEARDHFMAKIRRGKKR